MKGVVREGLASEEIAEKRPGSAVEVLHQGAIPAQPIGGVKRTIKGQRMHDVHAQEVWHLLDAAL